MWSPSRAASDSSPSSAAPVNTSENRSTPSIPGVQAYQDRGTYIGKSLSIKGEITGAESVHIDGRVEGPISLQEGRMNIGRDAVIRSNVEAGEVIVRGTMEGKLAAKDRVEVHPGGSLVGDVVASRISIEEGAYFHGKIDMRRHDPKPGTNF